MENYSVIFAKNLRRFRKSLKMTQEQLASRLNYTEKAVSKWESGNAIPPAETLLQLADVLHVTLDELFNNFTEPAYYLGIDGGGTKTTFILASRDGDIVQKIVLGPTNPVDSGFEKTAEVLTKGINVITANIHRRKIAVFAGISGGGLPDMKERFRSFLEGFDFFSVENGSDAENIIAAGLRGSDGIVLIMGTGSSCFACVGGKSSRIGGWGYLFDHAGGGYDLGNAAITAACRAEDGTGDMTLLREMILENLKAESMQECLSHFYSIGKVGIASFAPIVFEAAEAGDAVAREILRKNMAHVSTLIRTAVKKFDTASAPIKVVFVGGLTKKWDILAPLLKKELERCDEGNAALDLTVLRDDVAIGALFRAGLKNLSEKNK